MDHWTTIKLACFVLATGCLAYVSGASLAVPRSHGFYRFFAWEAILSLSLLNIEIWFQAPFSWHQIVSLSLLIISAVLVIVGVRLLKHRGAPDSERDDMPLIAFEKTTALIAAGAYHYIRHPLYGSLLFLAWDIFFKGPSWLGGLLAVTATLALVAAARVEETENIHIFGQAYRDYMKQTKMSIPFLL